MAKKNENSTSGGTVPGQVLTIGLPRALLYDRYQVLWKTFFGQLGAEVRVSPPTTLETLNIGSARAIDEMCLSVKLYLGHVEALIGKCDYILVPRISNFGIRRYMCTTFEGMYDICRNLFRKSGQKFLSYNIDVTHGLDEETAFIAMAGEIGFSRKNAVKAYKAAKKAESDDWKRRVKQQEALYKNDGLKVMIASHSYVEKDAYIGRPVTEFLKNAGVTVLYADVMDRKDALKQGAKLSPTMRWELNREIAGGIYENRKRVDGIILLPVFPCGPDAMTNDMIIRRVAQLSGAGENTPILNLMLDAQSGMAGIETRLESFIDILTFKKGI
ncbi:MAG: acyl-CoA dehydratase activase-related protein [Lachnospiraceae bacterium]|nr:acyl-CoA dehydratase activase-related protein [Lachnospiraceae bacterium]